MDEINVSNFVSGKWEKQFEYQSFLPEKVNQQWVISSPELLTKLSEANRCLGKLDAFSDFIPDVDFFIKMHVTKEATVSSKIEGTQTSFEEALVKQEDINPEKRDDWKEVHNYIQAVNEAIIEMRELPISNRLIKNTHRTLLQGVRGKQKLPGDYRSSQNWIGSSLKNAIFVPPTHDSVPELMHDLEQFINSEITASGINVPHLIKLAIIHYQFETIHPFLDGNGRIGRLLITLYLIDKGLLKNPTLYLSEFFEKHRRDYYDNLTGVRTENRLSEWILFFLEGIIETAKSSIDTFQRILTLRNDIELNRLIKLGRKQSDAKKLINELYKQPIMDGLQIAQLLNVHASTANRMVQDFENLGILKELTGYKRNRIYAFQEYIKLF